MPDHIPHSTHKESFSKVSRTLITVTIPSGNFTIDAGCTVEPELTKVIGKFKSEIRIVLQNYLTWLRTQGVNDSICYDEPLVGECDTILNNHIRLAELRNDLENYISTRLMPRRSFLEKVYMAFNKVSNRPHNLTLHLSNIMKNDFYMFNNSIFELEENELRKRELDGGYSLTQSEHNALVTRLKRRYESEIADLNQTITNLSNERDNRITEADNMRIRAERAEASNVTLMADLKQALNQIGLLTKELKLLKKVQLPKPYQYAPNRSPDSSYVPSSNSTTSNATS